CLVALFAHWLRKRNDE
ncbi:type I toxin-antitoxin system Fst family toxin, partial [Staphylococcus saprophyticus]